MTLPSQAERGTSAGTAGPFSGRRCESRRLKALIEDLRTLEPLLGVGDSEQWGYRRAFLQTVVRHLQLTSLELWWMGHWRDVPWIKCMARASGSGSFSLVAGQPIADIQGAIVRTLRRSGVYVCNDAGSDAGLLQLAATTGQEPAGPLLAACVSLNGHACSALAAERALGSGHWTHKDVEAMRRASALYALHLSRVALAARSGDPCPDADEGLCHCLD